LKTGERKVVFQRGSNARYVRTGHIVYALGSTVLAVGFDVKTLRVTGAPAPIIEGVMRTTGQNALASGLAQFAFSDNGTLVYVPENESTGAGERVLAFIDRSGNRTPINIAPGVYNHPRVSPNGKQLALQVEDA